MTEENLQTSLDAVLNRIPRKTIEEPVHTLAVCEDDSREKIIQYLKKEEYPHKPKKKSETKMRAHIGVAGFFNFEIMSHTLPDVAVLIDNNKNQRVLWDICVQLLKTCETSAEFKKKLSGQTRVEKFLPALLMSGRREGEYIYPLKEKALGIPIWDWCERLAPVLSGKNLPRSEWDGTEWLRDEGAYQHMRQMALDGKIICASVDMIHDDQAVGILRKWMNDHGIAAETIYMSTIYDVMRPRVDRYQLYQRNGGLEEVAEHIPENRTFLKAYTFSDSSALLPSRMHSLVQCFMQNIQKLMSGNSICFLAEVNKDNGLAILDGHWAETYKPKPWPTFDKGQSNTR